MSTRKSSTEKASKKQKEPKVKKVKEPKVKKEKVKKTKSKRESEESLGEVSFESAPAPVPRRKAPKAPKDVYTLVLLLSFLFFVIATVFLYMDLASYK